MGKRIYDQREDNLRSMHERGERSLMERPNPGRIDSPHGAGLSADNWPEIIIAWGEFPSLLTGQWARHGVRHYTDETRRYIRADDVAALAGALLAADGGNPLDGPYDEAARAAEDAMPRNLYDEEPNFHAVVGAYLRALSGGQHG